MLTTAEKRAELIELLSASFDAENIAEMLIERLPADVIESYYVEWKEMSVKERRARERRARMTKEPPSA